jgi:diguanylate cyclase (GGDEF)-like protein
MHRKLLIAETEDSISDLRQILSDEYTIIGVETSKEALHLLNANPDSFSAVLFDVCLPNDNGFEIISSIHCDTRLSHIPIIITGADNNDIEIQALQLGASDYIQKPYHSVIIKQRIKNAIRLRETAMTVNEFQKDRLTGLYNRSSFLAKATDMISSKPTGYYVMASFDIDSFKAINDQFGTEYGDRILKNTADSFMSAFHQMDGICCRMMADQFAALYPYHFIDSQLLKAAAQNAVTMDKGMPSISYSIGRYIIDDLSLPASAMYDRACLAKSTIKKRYDEHIAVFNESMRDQLLEEQKIVSEMKEALYSNQFETWFQPQYSHVDGSLIGAEALVRWRHPEKGLISPGIFIPIFEKNGFVYEVDKYVWNQVCSYLRKWIDEGRNPLPVSVNISRYDIFRDDFVSVLTGLIHQYSLPINLLRIEITESAFALNSDRVVEITKELVSKGFTLEIDDFGSGYSSLNTLKDVPAQIIKLDMKFFAASDDYQRSGLIVESMVRMAKWLNMAVIAEGVETVKQADFLKSIGCFYIHGYLYAKPMPVNEYENLARSSKKQSSMIVLETVENLNNNSFWDPSSLDTLMFSSYLGSACILEYFNHRIELLRANDKFVKSLNSAGMTIDDALKLDWSEYLNEDGRKEWTDTIASALKENDEISAEFVFMNLPGCTPKTHLKSTLRVIARTGDRCLVYCTAENITPQRIAEQKKQETSEQIKFLESVAHQLLTQSDPDTGIMEILKKILEYFNAKKALVFEFNSPDAKVSESYELTDDGTFIKNKPYDDLPIKDKSSWIKAFKKHSFINIRNTEGMKDSPEKEFLKLRSIHSLEAVPLKRGNEITGFISIEEPAQRQAQIESLYALGDYISVLIARRDLNEEVTEETHEKLAVMDGIPGGFVRMQIRPDGSAIPIFHSIGFLKLVHMTMDEVNHIYHNNAYAGVHPDDRLIVSDAVQIMLKNGEAKNIRYRLKDGNGGYTWVVIFGKAVDGRHGNKYLNIYYADGNE